MKNWISLLEKTGKLKQFLIFFIGLFLLCEGASLGAKAFAQASPSPKKDSSVSPLKKPPAFSQTFHRQFGIGLTGVFGSGVFYPFQEGTWSYYHGGIQLDILGRLHPRLTLEVSPGVLISNARDLDDHLLVEFVSSVGLRIYLLSLPPQPEKVVFMPYVVAGFQLNALFGADPVPDFSGQYSYYTIPPSLYLGAFLGLGTEVRLKEHLALQIDIRGFAQGALDVYRYQVYLPPRLGVRFGVGIAWYF